AHQAAAPSGRGVRGRAGGGVAVHRDHCACSAPHRFPAAPRPGRMPSARGAEYPVAVTRLPIVVLISGTGSNLAAPLAAARAADSPYEVVAVIADRDAPGLDRKSTRLNSSHVSIS